MLIIYYAIDGVVNGSRGKREDSDSAFRWMLGLLSVTVIVAINYGLNANRDLVPWFPVDLYESINFFVGIALVSLAPVAMFLVSKRISKLVFISPAS